MKKLLFIFIVGILTNNLIAQNTEYIFLDNQGNNTCYAFKVKRDQISTVKYEYKETDNPEYLEEKAKLDYLFIYYMPYDNDLSIYGEHIIQLLKDGTSENIGVVIQSDYSDTTGLKRYSIQNGEIEVFDIPTESTDLQVYKDYFLWINENFEIKNYCIIFLNHGGNLIEFGLDTYPERNYSNINDLTKSVEYFNLIQNNKAKLLFLQQCARGSIESIFEFENCADYTLFSQTILGAPNSYYKETLIELKIDPSISGKELANIIVKNEGVDMYNSYTLIDNNKIHSFIVNLKEYFELFEDSIRIDYSKLLTYNYNEETYWDLKSLLNSIENKNSTVEIYKQRLLSQINNNTIIHYRNPNVEFIQEYCGISFFSPYNTNLKTDEYQNLSIFKWINYKELGILMNKQVEKKDTIIEEVKFRYRYKTNKTENLQKEEFDAAIDRVAAYSSEYWGRLSFMYKGCWKKEETPKNQNPQ